jgi:5-methylcytosine-specific restriction endonuclease McrA
MSDTLILNADYQPISFVPLSAVGWQQAVKLHWLDRVYVLHTYDDKQIHSPSTTIQMPAVCATKKFYKIPQEAKFSRNNLFLRDTFNCQYCGELFSQSELTVDHVIPRSLGGGTDWENCVASCKACNSNKGSKLINPMIQPYAPTYWELAKKKKQKIQIQHPSWEEYLGVSKIAS